MKITKTFDWMRRDFSFEACCEKCNHKQTHRGGYDDDNYYRNVVPTIPCNNCGATSISLGTQSKSNDIIETRYNPSIVM